jgi:hypothetical protein
LLADDNLAVSYEWVRNPFHTPEDLSIAEKEIFTDYRANDKIKKQFSNKSRFEFWAVADDEFSALKTRTLRIQGVGGIK